MAVLQGNDRLDDFEIIRLIGRGGMGEVYEARQISLDRPVALKVLSKWLADDDNALERFWREAKVPANLDHPSIVKIISTGKTAEGVAYYAMHLVRGISLSELIARGKADSRKADSDAVTRSLEGGKTPSIAAPDTDEIVSPIPVVESTPQLLRDYRADRYLTVARIGAQAARALAYAHQAQPQGHLHRDIKPSNLMIDQHDQVYLVDFGLTRALQPGGSSTQPGVVLGTPWYMSPEQARNESLDARSDIYSLGLTLYELATCGLGPFTASRDDKDAVLAQVRAGQVVPLRVGAPDIPPLLERIIVKAMQFKANKRYATALELAHDLDEFLGVESKMPSRPKSAAAGLNRWRRALVGAGLLGAVVLILVAVAIIRQWGDRNVDPNGGLDGSQALPDILRTAPFDVAVPILRVDQEPMWHKKVYGSGRYMPWPDRLDLVSAPKGAPTFILVAYPHRRNFDFAVKLNAIPRQANKEGVTNEGGVFFGWQRPHQATDGPRKCFAILIDPRASDGEPNGAATIGTFSVVPPSDDGRGASITEFKPLSIANGRMAFNQPHPRWRTVRLIVRDQRVILECDGETTEFAMDALRRDNPAAMENVQPHGGIGIWARHGQLQFMDASVTARSAEN